MTEVLTVVVILLIAALILITVIPQPTITPMPRRYYLGHNPQDTQPGEVFMPCYERKTGDLIMYYAMIAESRQTGRCAGADVLIRCQDGLDPKREFDYDQLLNFYWLVRNGAPSGVFVTGNFVPQSSPTLGY